MYFPNHLWVQKKGTRAAPYLTDYDPPIEQLATITAGERGATQFEVADASKLAAGDVVQIQWMNRDGEDAKIIDEIYGADVSVGSHHWTFVDRPLVRQSSRIEAVDGNTVTLASPLLHRLESGIEAYVAKWEHLSNVGIEDLYFEFPESPYFGHHLERGYNAIYMTSAFDSWVRNVRFSNADSGILTYNSANLSLLDITSDGSRPAHNGVHMGNVHNVLAERVTVMNPVLHSLTFNTQSTKCVYKDAVVYAGAVLDQHAGSNHQNLYDSVTLYIPAKDSEAGKHATVFDGSGAGYWQPGHGAFNTTWNLNVIITDGAHADETVTLLAIDEGPSARIVGLHGNRKFELDYRPQPYIEALNTALDTIPSLYAYQKAKRLED